MKLSLQQLATHLNHHLLPIYLISGNELILMEEARDLIVSAAKRQGFLDIMRFELGKDFDWHLLIEACNSASLFCEKSLILLKLTTKLNAEAGKSLTHLIEHLSKDKTILLMAEKLDSATQKSNWVTAINTIGAVITIWPLDHLQCKKWVEQRLQQGNLKCDNDALEFLITQAEGNLLALAQEVEKLKLLHEHKTVRLSDIVQTIEDNSRYDVYQLIDIVLAGNGNRIHRVLQKFKTEGAEPVLLLWAFTREIRLLINILFDVKNKMSWELILKKHKIWTKRESLINKSLKQHTLKSLHSILSQAEIIDRMIKGLAPGNVWHALEDLSFKLAGLNTLTPFP